MLVVDDDARGRRLLEGYLSGAGYRVTTCDGGEAALASIQREVPDVVLLDVMMPEITGYEVCRRIKLSPRTRLCQVMLVTALDGTPDRVQGLDAGADDYVSKPVRREEFLAKVRALLRARRLLLELEQARADLALRNEELQLKKTLAQTLVHDLKNPLSSILGNLDLLEMRSDGELAPMVRRSKEGARRMLKMILNLLDVEGLEDGRLKPCTERLDAAEVARAAVLEVEAAARQRRVAVAVDDSAGAAWIEGDPVLLRRVLDNLLSNAISHSPADSTVRVRVERGNDGVRIDVSDEGAGIPAAHRERIFEKYQRMEMRREGITANRGLGLTFCRLAIEAHGGSIEVVEAPGGGALFRSLLPAHPVQEPSLVVQTVGSS
jgi:signal transduction histidine kinase